MDENQLMKRAPIDLSILDSISDEALTQYQMQRLQKSIVMQFAKMNEQITRQNEKLTEIGNYTNAIAEKISHNGEKGWYNLRDLGNQNAPSISNKQMSLILRKIGVLQTAKDDNGRYLPYHSYYDNKEPLVKKNLIQIQYIDSYGQRNFKDEFEYLFHSERTWKLIKKVFENRGILTLFQTCKTKNDISEFIKNLI